MLLSWLSLFHLSNIINDLLPVIMSHVNLELTLNKSQKLPVTASQVKTKWPAGEAVHRMKSSGAFSVLVILIHLLSETLNVALRQFFFPWSCTAVDHS